MRGCRPQEFLSWQRAGSLALWATQLKPVRRRVASEPVLRSRNAVNQISTLYLPAQPPRPVPAPTGQRRLRWSNGVSRNSRWVDLWCVAMGHAGRHSHAVGGTARGPARAGGWPAL